MARTLDEYMLTGTAPGESDAPRLSRAMQARKSLSTLAQLSGDAVLAPYGAQRSKEIHQEANQIRQSALERARQKAIQQRHEEQLAHQYRMHQERMSHDRAMIDAKAEVKKTKAVPKALMDQLSSNAERLTAVGELQAKISAGMSPGSEGQLPAVNSLRMWAASKGVGSAEDKARQLWWNQFRREMELTARHEMFGATLSTGEKQAWNAASANPEMTTDQITEVLRMMQKVYSAENMRLKNYAHSTGLYDPNAIEILAAPGLSGETTTSSPQATPGAGDTSPSQPSTERRGRVFDAATGTWE